jgi:phenylalanyl-tRNA synthetase beta chain
VVKDGVRLALIGEVHPRAAANFDLPGRAYIAEIDVEALMDFAGEDTARPNLSRFQAVDRDIAFLVATNKPASEITAVINAAGGEFRESSALFDLYQGKNIPEGQRSLAYRITFRADGRTLEDKEVDAAMTDIRAALTAAGATLR